VLHAQVEYLVTMLCTHYTVQQFRIVWGVANLLPVTIIYLTELRICRCLQFRSIRVSRFGAKNKAHRFTTGDS